jgi:hypothetical protein
MRRSAPGHKHASQQARRDEASASVTGRNRCSAANGARVPIPVMVIGEQSCCDALKVPSQDWWESEVALSPA